MFKRVIGFTKDLFVNFGKDDAFTLGAALSYYTVFSFAPLLVVAIAVASYFMGEEAVTGRLYGELEGLLGPDAAATMQEIVSNAYSTGDSLWATVLSVATLVFTATTVFATLKTSLNRIWEIEARPANNILGFIFTRLLSFSFVIGLGFLLMITLVVNALIIGFMDKIAEMVPALSAIGRPRPDQLGDLSTGGYRSDLRPFVPLPAGCPGPLERHLGRSDLHRAALRFGSFPDRFLHR